MVDFEYINTRIQSMQSRLLKRQTFDALLELPDLPNMIAQLIETPYGEHLSESLGGKYTVAGVDLGLQSYLRDIVSKMTRIAGPGNRSLILRMTESWDIQCLKTILRGVSNMADVGPMLASCGPSVRFSPKQLQELAGQPSVGAAVNLLKDQRNEFAPILLPLLQQYDETHQLQPLEDALEQYQYRQPVSIEGVPQKVADKLGEFIAREAEIRNIARCLQAFGHKTRPTPLPQGTRNMKTIRALNRAESYDDVIDALAESPFRMILDRALPFIPDAKRMGMLERLLESEILLQPKREAMLDPLGPEVLYSFLMLQRNEIINLRMIARSHISKLPKNALRAVLLLPKEVAA